MINLITQNYLLPKVIFLFIPQCVYRVETGSFPCRITSKEDADYKTHNEGKNY